MRKLLFALLLSLPLSVWALSKDSINAITMASYEQTFLDDEGTIALQNNTNEIIRQVKFQLTYFNMAGRQLDYENFEVAIVIDPGMTKSDDSCL